MNTHWAKSGKIAYVPDIQMLEKLRLSIQNACISHMSRTGSRVVMLNLVYGFYRIKIQPYEVHFLWK